MFRTNLQIQVDYFRLYDIIKIKIGSFAATQSFQARPRIASFQTFLEKKSGSNFFRKLEIFKKLAFCGKTSFTVDRSNSNRCRFFSVFCSFRQKLVGHFFRLPIFFRYLHRTRNSLSRNADDRFFSNILCSNFGLTTFIHT